MKQEMIHTPTPWRSKPSVPYIYGAAGGHAAEARNPANREFIVRACNAHDELVNALENCVDVMVRAVGERLPVQIGSECEESDWIHDLKAARAALAKAKGEQ